MGELKNKDGTYQSSLEAGSAGIGAAASAAIQAGKMPLSPLSDFSAVSLHNQKGANTWPIVAISHVYVRKDLTSMGAKACLLKAFLEFIISDEGQGMLLAYGAVGVPDKAKDIARTAINLLVVPACAAWTFEGSSTIEGGGQADYVISKKRRSFYEYDDGVDGAVLEALKGELAALKEKVAATPSPVTDKDDDGADNPIGLIALILSIVAVLMHCFVFFFIAKRKSGSGEP